MRDPAGPDFESAPPEPMKRPVPIVPPFQRLDTAPGKKTLAKLLYGSYGMAGLLTNGYHLQMSALEIPLELRSLTNVFLGILIVRAMRRRSSQGSFFSCNSNLLSPGSRGDLVWVHIDDLWRNEEDIDVRQHGGSISVICTFNKGEKSSTPSGILNHPPFGLVSRENFFANKKTLTKKPVVAAR